MKQPDLFNSVYGTRNGNLSGNDGYDFRGRGLIQITGRSSYQSYTKQHNTRSPEDQRDFENNATDRELVATNIEYAVESACWFWRYNGIQYNNSNTIADEGTSQDIVNAVGANINGWYAKTQSKFMGYTAEKQQELQDAGYVYNATKGIWLKNPIHHDRRLEKFNSLKNLLGL